MKKIYIDDSNQITNMYKKPILFENRTITNEADCMKLLVNNIVSKYRNLYYDNANISNTEAIAKANDHNCDYFISLHSNADNSKELQSTDIYYHFNSIKGLFVANLAQKEFKKIFPTRKVIVRADDYLYKSGLQVLRETNMPAILIENFWHDSYTDLKWACDNFYNLCEVYINICKKLNENKL